MMLAWLDARVNHCIQPISNAAKRPNAARVYRYGPPVPSKRLPTSAKQSAIDSDASPIATKATGLQAPTCTATCAGIRKIAAPMTWLMPIAVRSHRPSARTSFVIGGRLYHERSADRSPGSRGSIERTMPSTLPRRFYADPDFYRAELERFYFARWI